MIKESLRQRASSLQKDLELDYHPNFRIEKKDLLDAAFGDGQIKTVAELGCVWGVDCAYGLYALSKFGLNSVKMVDTHWSEAALEMAKERPEIAVFQTNFGDQSMPATIGRVDAVILFDVLLHQVSPDWDKILEMYAPYTKSFIIFNQQWIGSALSVRLLDMGRDEYFRNVPHDQNHPTYSKVFEHMYEMHPVHKKIWRDVFHVWQWGITTADLLFTMDRLGFSLNYLKSYGKMQDVPKFTEQAFIFTRCRENRISK